MATIKTIKRETVMTDSNAYTWSELRSLSNIDHAILARLEQINTPSNAAWATRIYSQARAHAKPSRGLNTGRLVIGLAFCSGFDAGATTPAAKLVGARQDHVLAFLAGAAYRDHCDGKPYAADHSPYDEIAAWRKILADVRQARENRSLEATRQ